MFIGVRGNAVQDIPVFWSQRKIPVDLHFIVRLLLRLEDVASVAPSIKVKILHLSTPPVHAGIVVDCPYARTMFECILVLSLSYLYVHAGIAVGCSCCRCMFESVLVMRLSTPPVHAGVAAACPCGRTLRSWSDVFPCGDAARACGQV